MSEKTPKSAYDVAMEKLKARDREQGVEEARPLSAEQKRRIAEIRTTAHAKLAEMEILFKSRKLEVTHEPDAREKADQEYILDRKRIEERADLEINRIRQGK